MTRRKPKHCAIIIINKLKGTEVTKRIKNSARTCDIARQYFGGDSAYFVYRVNVYLKGVNHG